jgi:tryptophan synthase beta chain
MSDKTRYMLDEQDMPTAWYNVLPDLPKPLEPPLDATGQPV